MSHILKQPPTFDIVIVRKSENNRMNTGILKDCQMLATIMAQVYKGGYVSLRAQQAEIIASHIFESELSSVMLVGRSVRVGGLRRTHFANELVRVTNMRACNSQ